MCIYIYIYIYIYLTSRKRQAGPRKRKKKIYIYIYMYMAGPAAGRLLPRAAGLAYTIDNNYLAPVFRREYTKSMFMFVKSLSYGSIHYSTYPEH